MSDFPSNLRNFFSDRDYCFRSVSMTYGVFNFVFNSRQLTAIDNTFNISDWDNTFNRTTAGQIDSGGAVTLGWWLILGIKKEKQRFTKHL